jgi:hypothetical protein
VFINPPAELALEFEQNVELPILADQAFRQRGAASTPTRAAKEAAIDKGFH